MGDKNLDEPLVIRPTSEVLFGTYFSKNISSYKDLPLKYNQWANVIRWEKTTRPFLRTTEFWTGSVFLQEELIYLNVFKGRDIRLLAKLI